MTIRVDPKGVAVRRLLPDERRLLCRLTMGRDSYMASVIEDNPELARCWPARPADGGPIVAWSLLRWFSPDVRACHNAYISVYVGAAHRHLGIGRRLVQRAMAAAGERQLRPCFYGATTGQRQFYAACGAPRESITAHAFPRTFWAHTRFVKTGLKAR